MVPAEVEKLCVNPEGSVTVRLTYAPELTANIVLIAMQLAIIGFRFIGLHRPIVGLQEWLLCTLHFQGGAAVPLNQYQLHNRTQLVQGSS